MTSLIAQMTGQRVQEDVPVPVAAKARPRLMRSRSTQRRTAAAIMGMSEAEAIIPDDAEEIDNYGGPAGSKADREKVEQDQAPDDPLTPDGSGDTEDSQLITPSAALVAPDVTPHTLDPIDPSNVPQPKAAPAAPSAAPSGKGVDPMDILLGRNKPSPEASQQLHAETTVTTESAQAAINSSLGVGVPADLLGRGKEMPPPQQADSKKIMEAFYKFHRR